jgi:hypothetical protein
MVKVDLNEWEEVDFFDIRAGDEVKHIRVTPVKSLEVTGYVTYTSKWSDGTGRITIERGGHRVNLNRESHGKPQGVNLYRRKPPAFQFPTRLGAVVKGHWAGSKRSAVFIHTGTGQWIDYVTQTKYIQDFVGAYVKNLHVLNEGTAL